MTLYVLDTDTLQLYQEENPKVVAHVRAVAPSERAISVMTVEEQLSGWYAQLRQANGLERLAWAYRRLSAETRRTTRPGRQGGLQCRFTSLSHLGPSTNRIEIHRSDSALEVGKEVAC
ncbi:MAG: hypothetical protein ACJ8FY_01545 [Gemmataceae bacterium]